MTAWESIQNITLFLVILPITAAAGICFLFVCTIDTDNSGDPLAEEVPPDTSFYSDTIFQISGAYQIALQRMSFLELCE